jgi:hypothetical protein
MLQTRHRRAATSLAAASLLLLSAMPSFGQSSRRQDHASLGNDITVTEGDTSADIACAFCSVHIHGDVRGDVAVLFGSVTLDSGHRISGDVAILGGDLTLGDEALVGGDVAVAAGDLNLAPTATVHGDRAVFPGRFWLLAPLLPLFVLIGIIWLIVYLVRRNRYRYPAYPGGPPIRR